MEEKRYPYLGRNLKAVIQFLEKDTGVCVASFSDEYKYGKYGHYDENDFPPLPSGETIILHN